MLVTSYKQEPFKRKTFFQRHAKALSMSGWSFILVTSTIGMALVGHWLDTVCSTEPMLMLGLMVLANTSTVYKLYVESRRK